MNTIKVTTTQNIELEYDLASLGERMAGAVVDILIKAAFAIVFLTVYFNNSIYRSGDLLLYIFLIIIFTYDFASEVLMNGQTVGKRVMNIKVVSLTGGQPTIGQYLIRWLFRPVDFYLTGFLCGLIAVAVSDRKQRIGDLVAGTTVIKIIPRTDFQQTIYTAEAHEVYKVSFPEVSNLTDADMQLIKEVILNVNKTGNTTLARHASDKIKTTLQINTDLEPERFLRLLLTDYNHLTSGVPGQ